MTGKGAEITGGRWNAVGTPMLYASPTIAMACLETIVHLDSSAFLPLNRYLVKIDVPRDIWGKATQLIDAEHVGWDALPAGAVSIGWGTNWCAKKSSLLALVPSVVIPEEFNVLINPFHLDLAKIKATKIRKWNYDPRAFGRKVKSPAL